MYASLTPVRRQKRRTGVKVADVPVNQAPAELLARQAYRA
jgi:hypothetical protein